MQPSTTEEGLQGEEESKTSLDFDISGSDNSGSLRQKKYKNKKCWQNRVMEREFQRSN
jgi:hypothetical protein